MTTTTSRVIESDWLASEPTFYNEKTGKVSTDIHDVIDYRNLEFHPEGFHNYLDFGYSVLGQTPVKHVKFMPPHSTLTVGEDGSVRVRQNPDPTDAWFGRHTSEQEAFDCLRASVANWERSVEGEIVIPTSGGHDSRLLNLMVTDRSRIRSFTYGISPRQNDSYEVVYARRLSEMLGTRWQQIRVGDFNHPRYLDEWERLYGPSVHIHGILQMEFFEKIVPLVAPRSPLLSGLFGDTLAGLHAPHHPASHEELGAFGQTKGHRADPGQSLLKSEPELRSAYFDRQRERLAHHYYQTIERMRLKGLLLGYLVRVPRAYGFQAWSPFTDPEVALRMLTIPLERRLGRVWQSDYFRREGMDLARMNLRCTRRNNVNTQGIRRIPLGPLRADLLREVVRPEYVDWIHRRLGSQSAVDRMLDTLGSVPKIGGALRKAGLASDLENAFAAWRVLKPIETLLVRRDAA